MGLRKLTKLILISVASGLIAYDVYAYLFGDNSTISVVIYDNAKSYPIIPFLFGVLMGHLFWGAKGSNDK